MATIGELKRKGEITATKTDLYRVKASDLKIDPNFNIRKPYPEHVEYWRAAIRAGGPIPAVYIRTLAADQMMVVDGQHRVLAHIAEGVEMIAAQEIKGSDAEIIAFMIKSSQGKELTAFERAEAYKRKLDLGETAQEIADSVGRAVADVRNHLMLLEMPWKMRIEIDEGRISYAEALKVFRSHKEDAPNVVSEAFKVAQAEGKEKVTAKHLQAVESSQGKAEDDSGNDSQPQPKIKKPFGAAKARRLIEMLSSKQPEGGEWLDSFSLFNYSEDEKQEINRLFREAAE